MRQAGRCAPRDAAAPSRTGCISPIIATSTACGCRSVSGEQSAPTPPRKRRSTGSGSMRGSTRGDSSRAIDASRRSSHWICGRTALRVHGRSGVLTSASTPQPPTGTLHVTVVDPSGAVIVGATVTVTGVEDATKAVTARCRPVQTRPRASRPSPAWRRAATPSQASFPDSRRGCRRARPQRRQPAGRPAADRRRQGSGGRRTEPAGSRRRSARAVVRTTLTREQIEALSDDPDELRQQLQDMAGPGAVIKVDSFEGGALPPKAQIRSIRISRDQFAAENHSAGGTSDRDHHAARPRAGPLQHRLPVRGGALSGRSPFTPTRARSRIAITALGCVGTLIPDKSSFNLFVERDRRVRHAEHQRRAARRNALRGAGVCGRRATTSSSTPAWTTR